ncbi:phosphatase PAP2 family protein [Bacillus sp. B190/17]|uniref:Phosphatase PAP2 family protein n=1 Tax=Bacillus lumedeiriae TaxID=3058829 RepID=A0ABW8I7L7_9BACI
MKKLFFWISLIVLAGLMLNIEQPLLQKYDVKIILFFEGIRTEFLNGLFYLFTEIGSFKVLLPVAIIVSIVLVVKKLYREAFFVMLVFWGVRGANRLLKELFERERPSFNAIIEAGSYSFPSGHAMNSTAFLGFLFYLLTHIFKIGKKRLFIWLAVTIATVTLIAVSRVYLGVHYLTDIAAGACGGYLFLIFIIYLYEFSSDRKVLV